MAAQGLSPLAGYEQLWGNKKAFVGEVFGPTLYAAGGQTINASQLGWGGFDFAMVCGLSASGTFYGYVQPLPVDATPSLPQQTTGSFKLMWRVLATGAEAGAIDLSNEVMKFFAIGV
jgi:hypothetical protein